MIERFCNHETGMGGCAHEKFEGELSLNCGMGCPQYECPEDDFDYEDEQELWDE